MKLRFSTSSFSKKNPASFLSLNFAKFWYNTINFFSCKIMFMFPSILSINHLVISPTKIHTRIDWKGAGFSEVAKKLEKWANQITNRSLPLEWSIKETSEQSQIWQVCMHFLDFYFLVFFPFHFCMHSCQTGGVWLICHRGWIWHVKFIAFSWQ